MRDIVDLGVTAPPMENCAQVGSKSYDYYERARREGRALIQQLRRLLGNEPAGASLRIKSHPHDFGEYRTVVVHYDTVDRASVDCAWRCEEKCPDEWDEQARHELNLE